MALDFSNVRYIVNGEPLDAAVLNRPVSDLAVAIRQQLSTDFPSTAEVQEIAADEALINAIIFGGK